MQDKTCLLEVKNTSFRGFVDFWSNCVKQAEVRDPNTMQVLLHKCRRSMSSSKFLFGNNYAEIIFKIDRKSL